VEANNPPWPIELTRRLVLAPATIGALCGETEATGKDPVCADCPLPTTTRVRAGRGHPPNLLDPLATRLCRDEVGLSCCYAIADLLKEFKPPPAISNGKPPSRMATYNPVDCQTPCHIAMSLTAGFPSCH
jgi:hypothetical protein